MVNIYYPMVYSLMTFYRSSLHFGELHKFFFKVVKNIYGNNRDHFFRDIITIDTKIN